MDIKALLQRIEGGERSAFAPVVEYFQSPLFGYLGRMGLHQEQAEEIAQETFLRAWSRLSDYDPARAEFSTWLFTIARNLALHELSRAAGKHEVEMSESLPDAACILHAAKFSVFENSWNFSVISVCILLLKRLPRSRRQVSMLSLKWANVS